MKKKILIISTIVILLAISAGLWFWYQNTYVQIEEDTVRCDIAELTLTAGSLPEEEALLRLSSLELLDARSVPLTIEEYEHLRTILPACRILWNVPFQGNFLPETTAELTITSLTKADIAAIAYLPEVISVKAAGCRDFDELMLLKAAYPDLQLSYTVSIQGVEYPENTTALTFENADFDELAAAIPYLPDLASITFTGTIEDQEAAYRLMCDYPHIRFQWNMNVLGVETPNTATELILSGIPMKDTAEVESYLKYFPALERVEMCDCGISSDEMDALSQRWPDIRFIWTIQVGRGTIRTDTVGFIPWKFGYDADFPLYDKDCKELKYCVDMVCLDLGHMKITDLSFLYHMPKLKYLIVGELPCPDFSPIASLKELIYLEIFNTTFNHQEILLELPKLQDLNMGSTKVYGTEVLKQMTWLKRLWLAGTGLTFAEYDELVEALPDTQVVMHIPHSTAGGWRDHQNYRDMRDLLGMFYME